jgi:AcrR family transcriptional regulator
VKQSQAPKPAGDAPQANSSTPSRVLDVSAELFNIHGVEAVSVGMIAETMQISPGNLTYHFRRKADLIHHHFRLLEACATSALVNFPVTAEPRTFARALFDFMSEVYSYRFLFLGASFLEKNDLISVRKYRILLLHAHAETIRQVERLIEQGHMPPLTEPITVSLWVESIWWQWLGKLLALQITPPRVPLTSRQIVGHAIIEIILSNPHSASLPFFQALRAETLLLTEG